MVATRALMTKPTSRSLFAIRLLANALWRTWYAMEIVALTTTMAIKSQAASFRNQPRYTTSSNSAESRKAPAHRYTREG